MTGKLYLGVDEAGRGSIVGEMIVAAFAVEEGRVGELEEVGVRDSKQLTREVRARLYRALSSIGRFAVAAASPREIDGENLNRVTARKAALAVSRLLKQVGGQSRVALVVVDKFGDAAAVKEAFRRVGIVRAEIRVEEKADARYSFVAAASIVAKHLRDERIEVLRGLYGVRGSGYPSDPETEAWLAEVFARGEEPPIIRYTWSTVKRLGGPWRRKTVRKARTLEDFMA